MHTPETHEQLGRILRDARLSQKRELHDISRRLHIRHLYLEALEDGTLSILPGNAYVKGYLHRYAWYLGLPADEIIAAYERIGVLPPQRLFHIPEHIRKEEHPGRVLIWGSLLLAMLGFTAWNAMHPRVTALLAFRVQSPPISDTVRAAIRTPACLRAHPLLWPPCYYEARPLFSEFINPYRVHPVIGTQWP